MDLFSLSLSVCVLMVCLPGAARFSRADENSCPCLEIPQSTTRQEACFQTGSTYSYTCVEGDARTLRCKENEGVAQWTKYQLDCIPYQRRTTTQSTAAAATDENGCPCPEIPERNLTKPPTQTCFQIGSRFHYQCIDGYVRKSGTSNLIKCEATGGAPQWTQPTLECIPTSIRDMKQNVSILSSVTEERNTTESTRHDENGCPCPEIPERNLTKPPTQTCFQIGSRFHYQCIDGYVRKSGTSNLIKCEATGGAPQWTQPTLECIPTSIRDMKQNVSILSSVTEERNTTESTRHDENGCPCPEIPERNLTKPPTQTCFQIGSRFRYQCIDGYVRKSGTSNLIKCEATGGAPQWTQPTLECIHKNSCPCLKNPHGNFTKSSPTACFQISNNYSYPCKEFYMKKMGTSNVMKCKHIEGVPRGTEYRLECTPTSTSEMMPSASASPSVTDERNSTEAITHGKELKLHPSLFFDEVEEHPSADSRQCEACESWPIWTVPIETVPYSTP
ncbi:interleukin-15 receptor subunit alpha [Archocentrus centrarchus]|uniref:interleukin-15 receptor subunit alpha n=1 Tax=Archocentrus centrarchus TaxID=63155 RepID=UPI0011E9EF18|nr:interleukin-2 receptor subunit alpha [Archocentrus centrarchus]